MNTLATAEAITVRNPWYNPRSAYTQGPTITYKGRRLFSHRGVEVYRNVRGSYDYVIAGCAIDQRAGFSRDNAADVIDGILDGDLSKDVAAGCCDAVADHLESIGHQPMRYSAM